MAIQITQPSLCKFLAYIQRTRPDYAGCRILECGAGGEVPPLAMFHEQGFEIYGIDIDDDQIERAQKYAREHGLDLHMIKADMRETPFEDDFFDFVYEFQAMCHLTKPGIRQTIAEMHRIMKTAGLCFLTVMTRNNWPLDGKEIARGEFQSHYEGKDHIHSYFDDDETDGLFDRFTILRKERRSILYANEWAEMSEPEWMAWYCDDWTGFTREEWLGWYPHRKEKRRLEFIEYIVKKG
ncbi:MAG: class I SAM-dependent methyltransferase [candidate division Zixibacteria bacterium]|nr:class I SAM-dependent methyltransferase [candidate division Zixibacteria bacterium]